MPASSDRIIFRKLLTAIMAALLLASALLLSGCKKTIDVAEEIHISEYRVMELTISLPEGFEEYETDNLDGFFFKEEEGTYVCVAVKKTPFTEANRFYANAGEWTVEQYAKRNSSMMGRKLQTVGGIPFVEYNFSNESTGTVEYYVVSAYKGADAFWVVLFCTREEDSDRYREQFLEWAQTVGIDGSV